MDTCSREYMFASELITNVMQLHCSTWKPDIKPSYEKDSPFTSTVEEAIHFIWNEKKEFVNDLFSTVLRLGTINVANYEAPVKFASHLVTEAEYDEIELLRYCVIAASYATLFYQNGLADVPDRCLHFIYDTITTFKTKNEFDDESWFDIELLGHAYCKSFSEDCYSEEGVSFLRSCESEGSSSNFQRDFSDRNAIKNENNGPCAIKEPLQTCITSDNFSCRATTSKECGTILPRTKVVKRKHAQTKREVKKKLRNSNINTNSTNKDVPKEVAETKNIPKELSLTTKNKKCSRQVTCRSKKVAKTNNKFPKNTDIKDSFVEVADIKHLTLSQLASKNRASIDILTKCEATKVKSSNDAAEKYEVIDYTDVKNIRDCDEINETEYTIKNLNGTKLQINKITSTKCKSKKVKSSKQRSKNVARVITTTEKNADDKYTSQKVKSNKNTFETISNADTQHVSIGCTTNVCTRNKIAPQELSTMNDIKPGIQAIRPKTNKIICETNIIKGNKYLVAEVADSKAVAEEFLSSKYMNEKAENFNDYAQNVEKINAEYRNVEPIYDNIKKVKQINHASAVEKTYAETIYGNKIKKCEGVVYANSSNDCEEARYANSNKDCEGASYGNVKERVEETRCASKICTVNNNKLKPIHRVKKTKVLKYKNKNVGFKGTFEKSTKKYALNINLKHKLSKKKPSTTNMIDYGKCVDKFAELETSGVNSSTTQYSNENVRFPLVTSDKKLIKKNTKMRSPLSKISANYVTELEEKPRLKDKKYKD